MHLRISWSSWRYAELRLSFVMSECDKCSTVEGKEWRRHCAGLCAILFMTRNRFAVSLSMLTLLRQVDRCGCHAKQTLCTMLLTGFVQTVKLGPTLWISLAHRFDLRATSTKTTAVVRCENAKVHVHATEEWSPCMTMGNHGY